MLNYIKADLYRITKKKSLYVMMALFTLIFTFASFQVKGQSEFYLELIGLIISLSPLLIGVFVFTATYTDDLKSHAVQTAIGFGFKRTTITLIKFIEAAIVLLLFYIYALVHVLIIGSLLSMNIDLQQIMFMSLTYYILTLVYFAISAIVVFSFQKATLATILYVLLATGIINQLLGMVLSLGMIQRLVGDLSPFLIENVIMKFNGALNTGIGIATPTLIIITYLVITTTLTSILFNKVELDF